MEQTPDNLGKRIGQIAGLCVTGQIAAAELELSQWSRESDCPPVVRVMQSALLTRRGCGEQALDVLAEAAHDPLELLTRLCLLAQHDASDPQTHKTMTQLHDEFGHLPFVRRWLKLIAPPQLEKLSITANSSVEQLATELLEQPTLIRSLVIAQQYEPHELQIDLLRRAIGRIAPEFQHDRRLVMICQALGDLAMLADDIDDARRWAHRGLKIDPFAAPLALILSRIDDDLDVGPAATIFLKQVNEKYPRYPDVHAALIRREVADGKTDTARHRLGQWLEREPACRLARTLQHELEAAA